MQTPLLRVIPIDPRRGTDVARVLHFDKPQYMSLSRDSIEDIEIRIYNINGTVPIPFASPTVLKLHFRRRRPWDTNTKATV